MIERLIFGLAIMIVLVEPTMAASVVRIRILTEDAYVNEYRDGICTTVQVTRETFSNGDTDTVLFVSAYRSACNELGTPIFPQFIVGIDSSLFVMNRQGTRASVNHPMAAVVWTANGLYTEEADSTRKVVDRRESPATEPHAFRLTEKERMRAATAEGCTPARNQGDVDEADVLARCAETSPTSAGTSPPTVDINSEVLSSGGFVNSFITVRRTTRIDRVFP